MCTAGTRRDTSEWIGDSDRPTARGGTPQSGAVRPSEDQPRARPRRNLANRSCKLEDDMGWRAVAGSAVLGYLLGSLSFVRLIARRINPSAQIERMDVQLSSGVVFTSDSVSATSARIHLGTRYGLLTGILDMLKVAIPTLAVRRLVPRGPAHLVVASAGLVGHDPPSTIGSRAAVASLRSTASCSRSIRGASSPQPWPERWSDSSPATCSSCAGRAWSCWCPGRRLSGGIGLLRATRCSRTSCSSRRCAGNSPSMRRWSATARTPHSRRSHPNTAWGPVSAVHSIATACPPWHAGSDPGLDRGTRHRPARRREGIPVRRGPGPCP
ncbi:MAG: glycerol-3-phosphate acyltransferase [Chloroflexi bacterium]|nr:glycerol-3-phosphate acyltransferase [Chloroflexota bacterium]